MTCVCTRTQVREFVQREVEPLDKEVEQIQIMALCQVLCAAWIATAASPRMGPSTCGQCEAARALPFMKLSFIVLVLLCVVWVSSGGVPDVSLSVVNGAVTLSPRCQALDFPLKIAYLDRSGGISLSCSMQKGGHGRGAWEGGRKKTDRHIDVGGRQTGDRQAHRAQSGTHTV